MNAAIAEHLIKAFRKEGADDVVVQEEEETITQIKFSNSKIVTTQTWNASEAEVFVAKDKRIITTRIKELTAETIAEAVKRVMQLSDVLQPDKEYRGIASGPFSYKKIDGIYDTAVAELGEGCVDLVEKAVQAAAAAGVQRCDGVVEAREISSHLLTSNSAEATEKRTHLYASIRAIHDKYATGHQVENVCRLRDLKLEKKAAAAADVALQARNPKKGKAGIYDVLFEPLPFAVLAGQLGSASSFFSVESGLSCLAGRLGKKVASSALTLTDDATIPGGVGSSTFDAEGVPTQRNVIIEKGILKNYLHNTSTAKRQRTVTTANAGLVAPTPFQLVVEKGNLNKEELLAQLKEGLLITNVWYTRFKNYATGDFSTIPRDGIFLVKNGKIAEPLKEIRVSENLLALMQNVTAIGSDTDQVKGWENEIPSFTPPVVVRNVNITTSVE